MLYNIISLYKILVILVSCMILVACSATRSLVPDLLELQTISQVPTTVSNNAYFPPVMNRVPVHEVRNYPYVLGGLLPYLAFELTLNKDALDAQDERLLREEYKTYEHKLATQMEREIAEGLDLKLSEMLHKDRFFGRRVTEKSPNKIGVNVEGFGFVLSSFDEKRGALIRVRISIKLFIRNETGRVITYYRTTEESRIAFTLNELAQDPNLVSRLLQETIGIVTHGAISALHEDLGK